MVRMWMVKPELMCNKHLIGEHCELHIIVGCINKKKSLDGYFESNCIEPEAIKERHKIIVEEMKHRNFNHNSELPDFDLSYLGDKKKIKINKEKSYKLLLERCDKCIKK